MAKCPLGYIDTVLFRLGWGSHRDKGYKRGHCPSNSRCYNGLLYHDVFHLWESLSTFDIMDSNIAFIFRKKVN